MNNLETATHTAIARAVEIEEGRLSPKKRLAIFSAVDCFAKYGYDGTSTKLIAENAGIAEATIFRHFGTKSQLLMRIAKPVIKHLLAPAVNQEAQVLQEVHGSELKEIARAILKSRLEFLKLYEPLVKIMLQEILVNDDLRKMLMDEAVPVIGQVSANLMSNSPYANIPHERAMRLVISQLLGYFFQRSFLQPERVWDDDEEINYIVNVVFNSLDAGD